MNVRQSFAATAAALVVGLLPSAVATTPEAAPAATSTQQRELLVIGDSMSAWYSDEDTVSRGWWSYVGERYGMHVTLSAETGSGMWAKGNKCQGTRAADRLHALDSRPDAVVVALGFNDTHGCDSRNRKVPIYRASSERAVAQYLDALAAKVDSIGMDRADVYVFTPWGSSKMDAHYWMWRAQKASADRLGFTYRVVRFNDRADTLDTIHPNASGSRAIAARFIAAGGIA